ncbi:MAG: threonine synthase [Chloroflexi bacterium]|nr:threonine synthase [Chloroflexota bacterium]
MKSYLSHLECTATGEVYDAGEVHTLSPRAQKVLYARYDLRAAARELDRTVLTARPPGIWRFFELMPVRDEANVVTMGEGGTPMLRARRLERAHDARTLYIKDEGLNPTGSFKARGLSAAVSRAKELGLTKLTVPSAGNAAGALAAYCARAGMECHVFMPADAPDANKKEAELAGAHVSLIDGLISDAAASSRAEAARLGLFDMSTLREPYRVEGKKTMGYEIAQDLGWRLPEAIIYPTGGGTGIVGMWKAFEEMEALGWIGSERPKMIVVQADGCAPIVRAFERGERHAEPWENAQTIAAGIRVPSAIGDYLILDAVRESGGTALTVSDDDMLDAMREMASAEGIWPAPEGAATLAGYAKLRASGFLAPETETVLMNTGSGLKYQELVETPG